MAPSEAIPDCGGATNSGGIDRRVRQPEWMDEPDIDPALHHEALRGLARINRYSGSSGILWPPIREHFRPSGAGSLRVLDLASGAGDVTLDLWRRAQRAGLTLHATGLDSSAVAVEHARRRAHELGAQVEFGVCDVLRDPLPHDCDIVVCSLFLHHLDDEQAVLLLRRMAEAARRLVLVNDLLRSRVNLLLVQFGCRLLTRSPVVHVDGPRSVAAAFDLAEARHLAQRAGLDGAQIRRRFPCRFLLSWSRPQ